MPPDNRWFGRKTITVQVGNTTVTRPIWFFFDPFAMRTIRQNGKREAAWYHYYKESNAVSIMSYFEFDASLGFDVAGEYRPWSDTYWLGIAAVSPAKKPVFNVHVADSYTEEDYPDGEGFGVHAVAKTCVHELWHGIIRRETRSRLLGGLGRPDDDGDGMSDVREGRFGTNPHLKDTCGLANYKGDDGKGDYSGYANEADQELFCRWKEDGIFGVASKDWACPGAQTFHLYREER